VAEVKKEKACIAALASQEAIHNSLVLIGKVKNSKASK
jgi:hypothetical protein